MRAFWARALRRGGFPSIWHLSAPVQPGRAGGGNGNLEPGPALGHRAPASGLPREGPGTWGRGERSVASGGSISQGAIRFAMSQPLPSHPRLAVQGGVPMTARRKARPVRRGTPSPDLRPRRAGASLRNTPAGGVRPCRPGAAPEGQREADARRRGDKRVRGTRRRPEGLRRQPLDLIAAAQGQAASVTPSGSFAPVMKATASDME